MEDDLLDLAADVGRYSRLACQIWLEEAWGELTVRMPGEVRDMQGR
jgi:ferredoxin